MLINLLTYFSATLSACIVLHWLYSILKWKASKYPPGPLPLPLVGSSNWFINCRAPDAFKEMRRRYGEVVTLHLGHSTRIVAFLSNDAIAKVFGSREMGELVAGRPPGFSDARNVSRGIIWADWPEAQQPRKFAIRWYREFGISLSGNVTARSNGHIHDEMEAFADFLAKNCDRPVKIQGRLHECLGSCSLIPLFGKRFDKQDPDFKQAFEDGRKFFDSTFLQIFFSPFSSVSNWLYPDILMPAEHRIEALMTKWLSVELDKRKSSFKEGQQVNDFVDAYLASQLQKNADPISFKQFMRSMVDLLIGGMETTSQATSWMIFYLAHFPEWQDELYEEIQSIVPVNAWPDMQHRSKLVKLEAVTNEVYRHSALAGLVLFHNVKSDFEFEIGGKTYELKAGTPVMYVGEVAQFDDSYWGDALAFRPERWLAKDPVTKDLRVVNHSHFMPFGIGKRVCPGEAPARMIMYLCMAQMLQRFKWRLAKDIPLDACYQGANHNPPQDYELILTLRE